jgi:hypothetical protein
MIPDYSEDVARVLADHEGGPGSLSPQELEILVHGDLWARGYGDSRAIKRAADADDESGSSPWIGKPREEIFAAMANAYTDQDIYTYYLARGALLGVLGEADMDTWAKSLARLGTILSANSQPA